MLAAKYEKPKQRMASTSLTRSVYTIFNNIHPKQILAVCTNLTIFSIQIERFTILHPFNGAVCLAWGDLTIRGFTKLSRLLILLGCRMLYREIEEIVFEQGLLVLLEDDKLWASNLWWQSHLSPGDEDLVWPGNQIDTWDAVIPGEHPKFVMGFMKCSLRMRLLYEKKMLNGCWSW